MSHHHLFSLQRDSLGYFHLKAWPPITPVAATYGKSYWDPSDWEYFNLLSLDGMIFNDTFTPFPTIIKVLRDVLQLFLRIVFEDFCIRSCSIANRVHLNVILRYRPGFWQLIKMAWIQYLAILFIFLFLFDRVKRFVFENQVVTTVPMKIEKEHLDW